MVLLRELLDTKDHCPLTLALGIHDASFDEAPRLEVKSGA